MSRIEQIIGEIEEYIAGCKKVPLSSSSIVVNRDELEELIHELRLKTPDEIKRLWPEYVVGIKRCMNAWGVSDEEYEIEVFDEPEPKHNPMEEVRRAYAEARAAAPKMRLLCTNGEKVYFDEICELTDAWIFSQHVFGLKQCVAMPGRMKAKGGISSLYACGMEMRQDLYRYYRLLAWKAAVFGSDAVSLYQFLDQVPAASFRQATSGGVAYDTAVDLVPSIRLENLYQGMTDIRYLRLLQQTAAAKKDHPVAAEAAKFAATALREIPSRYGHDVSRADAFRDRCVTYLRQLMAK